MMSAYLRRSSEPRLTEGSAEAPLSPIETAPQYLADVSAPNLVLRLMMGGTHCSLPAEVTLLRFKLLLRLPTVALVGEGNIPLLPPFARFVAELVNFGCCGKG
jgi:hypothetical protein